MEKKNWIREECQHFNVHGGCGRKAVVAFVVYFCIFVVPYSVFILFCQHQ